MFCQFSTDRRESPRQMRDKGNPTVAVQGMERGWAIKKKRGCHEDTPASKDETLRPLNKNLSLNHCG